jgi:hypothetical protein
MAETTTTDVALPGNVRNYWLAQTAEFIRHSLEPTLRDRLQQSFSGALRKTLASGNLGAWAPRQHQLELLEAIAGSATSEKDAQARLVECGAYVEKHVSNRISSLLFGIMTADMFLRRLQAFWERDHDHSRGKCESELGSDGRSAIVRLSDIKGYELIGPAWMGWTRSALTSLTHANVTASIESSPRALTQADSFQFKVAW